MIQGSIGQVTGGGQFRRGGGNGEGYNGEGDNGKGETGEMVILLRWGDGEDRGRRWRF